MNDLGVSTNLAHDDALTMSALRAHGILKSFGDRRVLNGIDVELAQGEHLAIIGPSGGGKSTFIRCLNLLELPDAGEIIVHGQPVWTPELAKTVDLRAHRKKIGMVFQQFNLFPTMSAIQNVSFAQVHTLRRSKEEANDRSKALLEQVGLGTHLGHRPTEMSGGQQQRVAIARALALDPEIMLFDEPTSAIDPEMRVEVLRVMKDLAASGMTMITVTHELRFAQEAAQEVIFLAGGVVTERGTPEQLFKHPENQRTRQFVNAVTGDLR